MPKRPGAKLAGQTYLCKYAASIRPNPSHMRPRSRFGRATTRTLVAHTFADWGTVSRTLQLFPPVAPPVPREECFQPKRPHTKLTNLKFRHMSRTPLPCIARGGLVQQTHKRRQCNLLAPPCAPIPARAPQAAHGVPRLPRAAVGRHMMFASLCSFWSEGARRQHSACIQGSWKLCFRTGSSGPPVETAQVDALFPICLALLGSLYEPVVLEPGVSNNDCWVLLPSLGALPAAALLPMCASNRYARRLLGKSRFAL